VDTKNELITIGWREWVALPELGIEEIKAKIDTGVRTSALHAMNLRSFRSKGAPWARFEIQPLQGKSSPFTQCEAPVRDHREILNADGEPELRIVVEIEIVIAKKHWPIEVTLTDRREKRFRLLLGRTAISGKALVDPRRSFVAGKSAAVRNA
jgi:hypothetical protein